MTTPCNIIIVMKYKGTHHLTTQTKHDTPFKKYTTHMPSFYANHTITRYLEDFSNLKPIPMYKKFKGHLEFWIKFWILD